MLDRNATDTTAIEERYVFRPGILRAFGWRVIDVPVTSWLRSSDPVIERIEAELQRSSWDLADGDPMAGTSMPSLDAETGPSSPVPEPDGDIPAAPEASTQATETSGPDGMTEYRLVAGSSNKYWRVGVVGSDLIVEFGRVGTKGQRVVKSYEDTDRARREANKLTLEKTRKGYEEFG